jgi:hypothetical protein
LTIERSTSDLHCIFLERPARRSANMRLRYGRGIHRRRDSATCAYPGTRMHRPSYLVWMVNNTRHLELKEFKRTNRNDSFALGETQIYRKLEGIEVARN